MPIPNSFLKFRDKAVTFALKYTKNINDAEDIVQEVYIKIALTNIKDSDFDSSEQIGFYINKAVKNYYLDKYNKTIKRGIPASLSDLEIEVSTGERQQSDFEYSDKVKEAMDNLDTDLKTPFVMHVDEGYSYKEISEFLKMPMGTVKNNIFRAKQFLRNAIQTDF